MRWPAHGYRWCLLFNGACKLIDGRLEQRR